MTNTVEAPIPSTSEERATKRIKFAGLPPYEARDNIDAGKQPAVCPVSGEPIWSDSFDVSKATSSTDSIKRELAAVKQLYAIYKIQYHALMEDLASQHSQLKASGSSAWKAPGAAGTQPANAQGQQGSGEGKADAGEQTQQGEDTVMEEAAASHLASGSDASKQDGAQGAATAAHAAPASQAAGTGTSGSRGVVPVRELLKRARNKDCSTATGAAHAPFCNGNVPDATTGTLHTTATVATAAPASPSHAGTASIGAVHGDSQQGVGATSFANWMGAPQSTPQSVNRPTAAAAAHTDTAAPRPPLHPPVLSTPISAPGPTPATPQQPGGAQILGSGPAAADGSSPAVLPAGPAPAVASTRATHAASASAHASAHASQRTEGAATYRDPDLGYASEDDAATYSDAEEIILEAGEGTCPTQATGTSSTPVTETGAGSGATQAGAAVSGYGIQVASVEQLALWRGRFAGQLGDVVKLEAVASAITEQELDTAGALACLVGRTGRYLLRRACVSLGRGSEGKGEVDVELGAEGAAGKVSRRQAYLSLEAGGQWRVMNTGRRPLHVDGHVVGQFESAALGHLGMLEVGGLQLMLMVNGAGVERVLRRTARAAI